MKLKGFSHYEIFEDRVTSLWKLPRTYDLTPSKKDGTYMLTADDGKRYAFSIGRLLFAAKHNIDPRPMPSGYVYVGGVVLTTEEWCQQMRMRLEKKLDKDFSNPIGMIDTLISELTIQKQFYQTGDGAALIESFYKRRNTLFADFCRKRAYGDERTNNIWEKLTDQFLERINKKRPISSIDSYILRMIPVMNKMIAEENKRKTPIIENYKKHNEKD